MPNKNLALEYLNFLEKGDMEAVIDLFSPNAVVNSPLYGSKSAKQFYNDLSSDTTSSVITIKEVFENSDSGSIVIYFKYKWQLVSGESVEFDVVDVFRFANDKIQELTIIYDTAVTRPVVNRISDS